MSLPAWRFSTSPVCGCFSKRKVVRRLCIFGSMILIRLTLNYDPTESNLAVSPISSIETTRASSDNPAKKNGWRFSPTLPEIFSHLQLEDGANAGAWHSQLIDSLLHLL